MKHNLFYFPFCVNAVVRCDDNANQWFVPAKFLCFKFGCLVTKADAAIFGVWRLANCNVRPKLTKHFSNIYPSNECMKLGFFPHCVSLLSSLTLSVPVPESQSLPGHSPHHAVTMRLLEQHTWILLLLLVIPVQGCKGGGGKGALDFEVIRLTLNLVMTAQYPVVPSQVGFNLNNHGGASKPETIDISNLIKRNYNQADKTKALTHNWLTEGFHAIGESKKPLFNTTNTNFPCLLTSIIYIFLLSNRQKVCGWLRAALRVDTPYPGHRRSPGHHPGCGAECGHLCLQEDQQEAQPLQGEAAGAVSSCAAAHAAIRLVLCQPRLGQDLPVPAQPAGLCHQRVRPVRHPPRDARPLRHQAHFAPPVSPEGLSRRLSDNIFSINGIFSGVQCGHIPETSPFVTPSPPFQNC